MRFFRSPSFDAAFNLALEELLFLEGASDCFMLWRNAPSVIIGRHQDAAARCVAPVLASLRRMGFACELSGRNDLLCGGVKISGCARTVRKNRMLFHGTILYDADLSVLGRVLTPDPEKMRAKGVASVRARVGNLRAMAGADAPDTEAFLARLAEFAAAELGVRPAALPRGLSARAEELASRKYRTAAWNWGMPSRGGVRRKRRFAAGSVAAETVVAADRIVTVRFSGDFFAERPVEELESALAGTVAEHSAVLAKLREIDAGTYIAGVGAEDLADLIVPPRG